MIIYNERANVSLHSQSTLTDDPDFMTPKWAINFNVICAITTTLSNTQQHHVDEWKRYSHQFILHKLIIPSRKVTF